MNRLTGESKLTPPVASNTNLFQRQIEAFCSRFETRSIEVESQINNEQLTIQPCLGARDERDAVRPTKNGLLERTSTELAPAILVIDDVKAICGRVPRVLPRAPTAQRGRRSAHDVPLRDRSSAGTPAGTALQRISLPNLDPSNRCPATYEETTRDDAAVSGARSMTRRRLWKEPTTQWVQCWRSAGGLVSAEVSAQRSCFASRWPGARPMIRAVRRRGRSLRARDLGPVVSSRALAPPGKLAPCLRRGVWLAALLVLEHCRRSSQETRCLVSPVVPRSHPVRLRASPVLLAL